MVHLIIAYTYIVDIITSSTNSMHESMPVTASKANPDAFFIKFNKISSINNHSGIINKTKNHAKDATLNFKKNPM